MWPGIITYLPTKTRRSAALRQKCKNDWWIDSVSSRRARLCVQVVTEYNGDVVYSQSSRCNRVSYIFLSGASLTAVYDRRGLVFRKTSALIERRHDKNITPASTCPVPDPPDLANRT